MIIWLKLKVRGLMNDFHVCILKQDSLLITHDDAVQMIKVGHDLSFFGKKEHMRVVFYFVALKCVM